MTFPIEAAGLQVHFCETRAVDDVSFTVAGGTICGLLGRNGAGKSTLLSAVAAFRRPTGGTVRVDGEDPYENPRLMSEICLVRSEGDFEGGTSVAETLEIAGELRPRWDTAYADRLVELFELPPKTKVDALSRGKRSALAVTVGLAARAPLTMFDEPHLGMDAPSRYAFYDELLADYMARPRTVVLSTHLIDEVASLFEDVIVLDQGRLLVHEPAVDLVARGAELVGPAAAVEAAVAGMRVVSTRDLGPTRAAIVLEPVAGERAAAATAAGVEIGPIPLQDLFVHLTSQPSQPSQPSQSSQHSQSSEEAVR
jgi:ABC-2 type transport system ATP-binding protein